MEEEKESGQQLGDIFNRSVTRRRAVQAVGLAALGLTFSRPAIETFRPKPAFASYTNTNAGNPGSATTQGGTSPGGNTGNSLSANSDNPGSTRAQGNGPGGGNSANSPHGDGGSADQPLAAELPPDPAAMLEPLGDNLVRLGEFNNATKKWSFYDPLSPHGGANRTPELTSGRVYLIHVKGHQRVVLNGRPRDLFAGTNYIVW